MNNFVNEREDSDNDREETTNTYFNLIEEKTGTRKTKKPVDTRTSPRTPTKRTKVTGNTPPETTTLKPLYGRVHPRRKGKKNEEIEIIDKTPESTDDEQPHEDVVTTNPKHQAKVDSTIDKTEVARRTSTRVTRTNETGTYNKNEFRFDAPGTTMRIEGSNIIFTRKDGTTFVAPSIGVFHHHTKYLPRWHKSKELPPIT